MTRRDLAWRTGGGTLFVSACGIGLLCKSSRSSVHFISTFAHSVLPFKQ